jgi:hypothetical protein
LFQNRVTGKISIVQVPNLPLAVFIAAAGIGRLFHPGHGWGLALSVVEIAALVWWSLGEIARGVNPFRRALGAVVLVVTLVGLLTR